MSTALDAGHGPARVNPAALGPGRTLSLLRNQSPFFLTVSAYCAVAFGVDAVTADREFSIFFYSRMSLILLVCFALGYLLLIYPCVLFFSERPARPLMAYLRGWKNAVFNVRRIALALPVLFALSAFISSFTFLKTMIPVLHAYEWDPAFAALDRALHGGVDPWRILHGWLGHPRITMALNVLYNLWFFVMYAVTFWQVFQMEDPRTRNQYLMTFVALWAFLGTFLATVFASVGPCFYDRLFEDAGRFEPLMAYLRASAETHAVWAVATQDRLWNAYVEGGLELGSGISAMPSLHVATATLFSLVGFRKSRVLGTALAAYAFFIFVGSIHLGWHYAVDGYVSVVSTCLIWALVGRALDARRPLSPHGPDRDAAKTRAGRFAPLRERLRRTAVDACQSRSGSRLQPRSRRP
jgi:hypothetical protein